MKFRKFAASIVVSGLAMTTAFAQEPAPVPVDDAEEAVPAASAPYEESAPAATDEGRDCDDGSGCDNGACCDNGTCCDNGSDSNNGACCDNGSDCDNGADCCADGGCDGAVGDCGCDDGLLSSLCNYDLGTTLFGECSSFDIGGWTQWGYTSDSTGLFNTDPHRFNNHQSWLYLEKTADGSCGFDWGGRIDVMYGTDANNTQAFGNNPGRWDFQNGFDYGIYGWAIPQAYVDLAYEDVSVKVGHFFTLLGYEVVTAPDNFFYSHAFTMNNSEAFTHTGALATYSGLDDVELYAGWTLGWDTGFDQVGDASAFLGGASVSLCDNATATYIVTAGDMGSAGDGYSHSLVFDVNLTDDLNYVFQTDLVDFNADVLGDGGSTYHTVGINQYLFYTISDELRAGGRFEWWKANGISYYSITGGLNIKPCDNLVVRPELRYQWSPANGGGVATNPAGIPNLREDGIFGVDVIYSF